MFLKRNRYSKQGSLAQNHLPLLKADPFAAPKVDAATNMGMTQAITPYKRSAKVWNKAEK